jgi:hypothetical protein
MFCEGGHFTIVPNVFNQIFGAKATQLYGFGFSYTGVMSLILLFLQKAFLNDSTYYVFFLIGVGFSCISLVLLNTWFSDKKYVHSSQREEEQKAN